MSANVTLTIYQGETLPVIENKQLGLGERLTRNLKPSSDGAFRAEVLYSQYGLQYKAAENCFATIDGVAAGLAGTIQTGQSLRLLPAGRLDVKHEEMTATWHKPEHLG